jgi:cytochrome b6-f complex iron-sulfur subunit
MLARIGMWPAVLGLALAMIVVTIIEPVPHSLAYASGAIVLIALLGWVLEAREVAGPEPEVEPEHEEEEEAPGPSYWPVILALGVVGIASGLVYDWEYGSLLVAIPLALGAASTWGTKIREEMAAEEAVITEAEVTPIVGPGGQIFMPVPQRMLATQAAGGAAIAIERVEATQISRRGILRLSFWTGFSAGLLALAGVMVDMLYPRGVTGFGGVVSAGLVGDVPVGGRKQFAEGKFFLVNLSEAQGGPGFLALYWKCPHLGCTVPYRDTFSFPDPATGQEKRGWFRCPCHGSTYNDAGVRVFGPAPRSMDRMELTIANGRISVNTGAITKGTPDNADFAVQP